MRFQVVPFWPLLPAFLFVVALREVPLIDSTLRYLARAFVSAAHVQARGSLYVALLSSLGEDFLPRPVAELSLTGQTVQRLGAANASGEWTVVITSESIDVQYSPRAGATGITFGEFCALASRYAAGAQTLVGQRASRVAVIREGLANKTADQLDALASRLLAARLAPFDGELFEWDWRAATRVERTFSSHAEPTNTIAILRRVEVTIPGRDPTDALFISTDVNTPPQRLEARFSPEDTASFVGASEAWHAALETALQVTVEGN